MQTVLQEERGAVSEPNTCDIVVPFEFGGDHHGMPCHSVRVDEIAAAQVSKKFQCGNICVRWSENGREFVNKGPVVRHLQGTVFRLSAAVGLSALMSACIVFPVPAVLAPKVSGVVLENGVPVEGAEIVLTTTAPFSDDPLAASEGNPRATVKTDADGRFAIGPLRGVKVFHALGDELHSVSLVIKDGERSFLGFADSGTRAYARPLEGTCDLARPVQSPPPAVYCDHWRLKKFD